MNTPTTPPPEAADEPTPEEIMSALFANMVIQNHNMAAMFLGKAPHPQTGELIKDLDSAQMFVDQLEMLAYKTRGNLNHEEKQLLNQSLTQLRLAFVEELRRSGAPVPEHLSAPLTSAPPPTQPAAPAPAVAVAPTESKQPPPVAPAPAPAPTPTPAPSTEPEESRKRFTKKY